MFRVSQSNRYVSNVDRIVDTFRGSIGGSDSSRSRHVTVSNVKGLGRRMAPPASRISQTLVDVATENRESFTSERCTLARYAHCAFRKYVPTSSSSYTSYIRTSMEIGRQSAIRSSNVFIKILLWHTRPGYLVNGHVHVELDCLAENACLRFSSLAVHDKFLGKRGQK